MAQALPGSRTPARPAHATADVPALADRVSALLGTAPRVIIGIAGPPGSGKSTLADAVAAELHSRSPGIAAVVPFDGFHLANAVLEGLGRADRKGAPDTFDLAGYRALIERLAANHDEVVYAPAYTRRIEEAIAGAIPVPRDVRVVITEGNYLLVQDVDLAAVRALLAETWYLDVDGDLRLRRLVDRHVAAGKTPDAAWRWATGSDERNAGVIRESAGRAHLRISPLEEG